MQTVLTAAESRVLSLKAMNLQSCWDQIQEAARMGSYQITWITHYDDPMRIEAIQKEIQLKGYSVTVLAVRNANENPLAPFNAVFAIKWLQ